MKGGNLQRIIGNGPKYVAENRAKIIAKKILEATAIMHSREMIHQDLKPSNILLADEDPELLDIRIADMGISRTVGIWLGSSINSKDNPGGTPGYMAPEVVTYVNAVKDAGNNTAAVEQAHTSGLKHISITADLWSLGCVIFAMLTGGSPYPDDKYDTGFPEAILEYYEVSKLGIEFIKGLVMEDSGKRMSAPEALDHK